MILSDEAIRDALSAGDISVSSQIRQSDIRSFGLRVHLATHLLVPARLSEEVDLADPQESNFESQLMDESGHTIGVQSMVLGSTLEQIRTSRKIGCLLDGRSSVARQGLMVHCASSIIDNIHENERAVVLELYNCGSRPIRIRPGIPIAMLVFFRLDGEIAQLASTQYADQQRTLAPRPGLKM